MTGRFLRSLYVGRMTLYFMAAGRAMIAEFDLARAT